MRPALNVSSALLQRLRNPKLLEGTNLPSNPTSTFAVSDPSDALQLGAPLAHVPDMSEVEVDAAIGAAAEAQVSFSRTLAAERSKMLKAVAEAQRKNIDDLALIMSCENGKTLRESKGEIEYAASYMEWFGEETKRAYGSIIPATVANRQIQVTREPVGVCAFILPFNFPQAMLARKAAAALAAGCAIVARPSEDVPLSAIALANIINDIFPKGVFNILTTTRSAEVGKQLCEDPRIAKLSFTGSTNVGKILLSQSASTIKRTSMELGGNASFIVFDDANLDAALDGLIASKFRNAGQTCVCSNRIFVQRGVYSQFLDKLTAKVRGMKAGRALDPSVDLGSLIHERAADRVEGLVKDAVSRKGVEVLVGGKRDRSINGNFFEPTVLANIPDDATVFTTEIFGPVVAVSPFEDEEEVIKRANSTRVGLSSYLFANNAGRIMRVSRALETGIIGVNTGLISTEVAPFGGVKESGFGREGSQYGLDDYTNLKYVAWQY